MNHARKLGALGAVLAFSASFAYADSVSLGSFATGTTAASQGFSASQTAMNFAGYTAFASPPAVPSTPPPQNGTAPTYTLDPTTVWAPAIGNSTWVGYAATAGPGNVNPPYGYYQFTTSFSSLGGTDYFGSMSLMADDTAEVLLNGSMLVPFGALGSDAHCADATANCMVNDTIRLSGLTLLPGNNVFTFVVEQAGVEGNSVDPSGMDFTASLATPEPSSLVLLGTGLLGGAILLLRRRDHGAV